MEKLPVSGSIVTLWCSTGEISKSISICLERTTPAPEHGFFVKSVTMRRSGLSPQCMLTNISCLGESRGSGRAQRNRGSEKRIAAWKTSCRMTVDLRIMVTYSSGTRSAACSLLCCEDGDHKEPHS
jgi:hypothetical protein